jgi:pyridoxamine-phosphate oxidase
MSGQIMDYYQALRKEYEDQGIDIHDLADCPFGQLEMWTHDAAEKSPGAWFEANAMSLATADCRGAVSVRIVLIKGISPDGILFFTNYESFKGRQLKENPNCSAAVHWPYLGRQVRFSGRVVKTSRQVSEQYFHSRPRDAQLSACISLQSAEIASRDELENQHDLLREQLGSEKLVPLPDNWGGYAILATEFEFWQGRSNRLHDRIAYRRQGQQWVKSRLAP